MFKVKIIWVLLVIGLHSFVQAYSARSYTQQNTQMILNSIDERLRNLDKSSIYRCADSVDQHIRKLETLEGRIERFETMLASRLDKIEGNISMQHFKDNLVQEQILRRIDAVYERVHHRIAHIEMKIDVHERKISEKLESMLKKFNLDEGLHRRSESDEEVAEVFEAVDEMKNTLHAGVANVTQIMLQKFDGLQPLLAQEHRGLLNGVQHLEAIVNASRYEQQNVMRNLVVLVGRIGGKNNALPADCANTAGEQAGLSQQLSNVSQEIAARFDTLMEQQSIFADSCHRIQSDEPQLESKISEILEKIIDAFEKESAVEIKDIQNIEQLIRSHDTSVRRSLFTTSHNMAVLLQKAKEHKDELALQIAAVGASTNGLESRLNFSALCEDGISKLINDLGEDLQRNVSQVQVQALQDALRTVGSLISTANVTEQQPQKQPDDMGSIDKNNIKIIEELRNLSAKIDAVGAELDADALFARLALLLRRYTDDHNLNTSIREVFGYDNTSSITAKAPTISDPASGPPPSNEDRIVFAEMTAANCTSMDLDVRMSANKCNTTTDQIPDDAIKFPPAQNNTEDGGGIDIRAGADVNSASVFSNESQQET